MKGTTMKTIRKIRSYYENHKFFCGVIAGEALMLGSIYYYNRKDTPVEMLMPLNEDAFNTIATGGAALAQVGSNLVWIAKEVHLPK